jgi:hypothetical protein
MKTQAAFEGPENIVVLYAVALKYFNLPVVEANGKVNDGTIPTTRR